MLAEMHDTDVAIRDVATGKLLIRLLPGRLEPGEKLRVPVAFAPDGRILIAGSLVRGEGNLSDQVKKYKFRIWELTTGLEMLVLSAPYSSTAALAPDGRMLITADSDFGRAAKVDTSARLWDLATGKELLRLQGHESFVRDLAISPDGKRLATGLADSTVLVWDLTPGLGRVGMPAKHLDAAALNRSWTELGGEDAAKARAAIGSLVASPAETVSFLKDRLSPAAAVSPERFRQLIANLDSERFPVREAASDELEKLGLQAEPALRVALRGNASSEVRRRVERVLAASPLPARWSEVRRGLRAIQVLEQIGTAQAVKLLQALAGGARGARLTTEASASLERLARRPVP
jgi:hypothetical protein